MELEAFLQTLREDPVLKEDVEFKRLVVNVIQHRGSAELKNYIRRRTHQAGSLRMSKRIWYYAAASVALILVSLFTVLYLNRNGELKLNPIAKNDAAQEDEKPEGTTQEPIVVLKTRIDSAGNLVQVAEPLQIDSASVAAGGPAYPLLPQDQDIILGSVTIVPIGLDEEIMTIESAPAHKNKRVNAKGKADYSSKPEVADKTYSAEARKTDSLLNNERDKFAQAPEDDSDPAKFKLVFYMTADNQQVITNGARSSSNQMEVKLNNVGYSSNPLILNYQNKYYLQTAGQYYEINITPNSQYKPAVVTDPGVIKALEGKK